ncbi:MAG: hypothetical protein ACRCZU_09905 [Selenomonadaceae bacterium]
MKQRQPSRRTPTRSHIISSLILVTQFFCAALAQADAKNDLITETEAHQVMGSFSIGQCNVPAFLKATEKLGFQSLWSEYDSLDKHPLSDLDPDAMCLIALSSSFETYRTIRSKDGSESLVAAGKENTFPSSTPVTEVVFSLPRPLAPKSCVAFEGATVPYVITVRKVNGKLVRDIRRTDANQQCFVSAIKKKGLRGK